jgi:hypothetical protein
METKTCKACGKEKETTMFPREMRSGNWYYYPTCKVCTEEKKLLCKKAYREKNKKKLNADKRTWYQENKDSVKKRTTAYRKNNRNKYNANARNRRQNDPIFQLRENVRTIIRLMLVKNYGSKNGASINDYLPYSIQELKDHLESKFEPWMNWNNHGKYDPKTWDDNDQSTWVWRLDHIIPQSDLSYSSMNDDNFKKCWALENLRPLSAKINSTDGASRIRHQVGR